MIPLFAFMEPPPLALGLVLLYLGAGAGSALALARRHQPAATAASALVAWPILLPLLWDSPRRPGARGPLAGRIEQVLDALDTTLRDPAAGDLAGDEDLVGLRASLLQADERLALVDKLLAEDASDPWIARDLDALRTARDHAMAEVEAVLSGVVQLRIQVGLLALAGNAAPVRDRLRELRGRIGALEEVSRLNAR